MYIAGPQSRLYMGDGDTGMERRKGARESGCRVALYENETGPLPGLQAGQLRNRPRGEPDKGFIGVSVGQAVVRRDTENRERFTLQRHVLACGNPRDCIFSKPFFKLPQDRSKLYDFRPRPGDDPKWSVERRRRHPLRPPYTARRTG